MDYKNRQRLTMNIMVVLAFVLIFGSLMNYMWVTYNCTLGSIDESKAILCECENCTNQVHILKAETLEAPEWMFYRNLKAAIDDSNMSAHDYLTLVADTKLETLNVG